MSISEKLQKIKDSLPQDVHLVAVTKTRTKEEIMEGYNADHKIFGENKVQEMTEKQEQLPEDISWHMIGHVQRNKVKYMAPYVSLIHGVDSLKLLKEINKQAKKIDRLIPCLLQVFIAEEETKFGLDPDEVIEILNSDVYKNMQHVNIVGLMGMATFTENEKQINKEFGSLKKLYDNLKKEHQLEILSMGMSSDYKIGIKNGSNMVRIGSAIFGERNY